MTQFEFYKSFLFVVELLAAESMYLYRFRRRPFFLLRLLLAVAACFLFAFFFPSMPENPYLFALTFLVIFLFTVIAAKAVFRESWFTVIFCCFAGYTTQHLSYEIYNIFLILMQANGTAGFYGNDDFTSIFPNLVIFAVYMIVYVVSYFLCFMFFSTKLSPKEDIDVKKTFIFIFSIFILIVDILLNAVIVQNPLEGGKLYVIIIGLYNVLCCIVSLYLQFEVALRRKIEMTFDFMQKIWEKTRSQYEASKENIEIINMKCHDIKHQIRALGTDGTVDPVFLKELEERVSIYDATVKTGNESLDVILMEKSLLCNKQKIEFSCMIDGEKLSFMRDEDIYALFGNIVDNAIEAVLKLDPAKRVIDLQVKSTGEMLSIRETNYYASAIVLNERGLPETTKGDRMNHGFGLKSIQYICERYGGTMQVETENDVFLLNIVMFPPRK